jgi:integrase
MLKLYRDKKSPYWYVRGTIAGRRICESTKTTDRGRAEAYRRKRDGELFDALRLRIESPATWSQAVDVYLDRGGESRFLLPITDRWKGKSLSEITQQEVDRVARELYPEAKAATLVRQVYGPVVSVLRAARHSGLPGAFVPLFHKPKIKRAPVAYASDGYLQQLLDQCSPGLAAAILLMTFTGLRTGEVLRLTEEDFRVRPGWVNVQRTKTGKPALIPLPDGWEWPKGGWGYKTSQGFNKALRLAAGRAGLNYLSGHKIGRHAFAARLLAAGYNLKVVKEAGRWESMKILEETYAHLEMSTVHDAMRAVSKGLMRKR